MDIYKITNLVNGKVYIGQSARGIWQRFSRHIVDATSGKLDTHLARAIRKYGKGNFVVECIDTADTQEELNQKEQYWIRYYDSVRTGYNETDATYRCGGNTYMGKNEYEMREISEKISISKLGARNPHSRKIKCRSEVTGEELIFETLAECQDYFGMSHHNFISHRLNGSIRSLFLTEWNFAYIDEPYPELEEYSLKGRNRCMRLRVTDLETGNSREYPSLTSLANTLDVPSRTLQKKIRGNGGHTTFRNYQIDILD